MIDQVVRDAMVPEPTRLGADETAQPVAIFLGAVGCYLVLALSAGWFFSVLEHRVAIKR